MTTPAPLSPAGPVDCHAHVFLATLPMMPGARYRPTADAALHTYIQLLDSHGMAGGVLVQVSFLGTDNSYLLAALATHPHRLRGVAVVDPAASVDDLAALRASGVVGARWNLIGRPLPDPASGTWRSHMAALRDAGLHLEIQTEGVALSHLLPAVIDAGLTVVVDHFGRPARDTAEQDPGLAAVLEAARHPSVWVKLSAPYRFSADAAAIARLIAATAGTDRLLWGSDWPWTQHPEISDYAALKANPELWLGTEAANRILTDNARRLYWRSNVR